MPPWPPSANVWTEADIGICVSGTFAIFERDEKAAIVRRVVVVINAAPSVDVDGAVRRHDELARVPNLVREDGGAEALRQSDASLIGFRASFLLA